MSDFRLRAIISAVDRLSPVLSGQMRTMRQWQRQFSQLGRGAIPMAAGLAAALVLPAKAFAEAEDASTQLKNTLMDKSGVTAGFAELSKIAIELGNKLPGTTADFMSMASQLKALGVSTDVLTGGALKATAYLAVVGKPLGVTYESAAQAVGKLGNSFGIAANDLLPFTDTLQRTLHMGIDLEQMQYAMARVSGPLKAVGKEGLGVAKDLVPLVSMLIQSGVTGEEAGTGIKKMISVAAMKGKFTTIPNLVKDLEKMDKLSAPEKLKRFEKLFGAEHAGKAAIIAAGGYEAMIKKMEAQASLQQRIANSLGTLTNLWEAATGTFTNAMVAFAEAYAPQLKSLADYINIISEKLGAWSKANGPTIRMAIEMAGAFVGLKLAAVGVAFGIGLITAAMRMNPIMLLVQAIAIAAPFIYEHWGKITGFIKDSFKAAIDFVTEKFKNFVNGLLMGVNAIRSIFNFSDIKMPEFKLPNMSALSDFALPHANGMRTPEQQNNGMRPPGQQRQNIVKAGKVSGGIDVNFNGVPTGTRVIPYTKGPVSVTPNVGYRSLGLAH